MMTKHQIRVYGTLRQIHMMAIQPGTGISPKPNVDVCCFLSCFFTRCNRIFFKCKTSCWLAIFPQDWMKIRSDQKVGATWGVPGFELLVLWFYLVLHLMKAALSVWECHDLVPQKTEFRGRSLAKMVATCRITILCITCLGFKHIEETDCDG